MLKTVTYNTKTHKVVALKPSNEMVLAAENAQFVILNNGGNIDGCEYGGRESLIYKAMLSAAPEFEGEK